MEPLPSMNRLRRWGLRGLLLVVLCALVASPALAQTPEPTSLTAEQNPGAQLVSSETSLVFEGTTGESLGRTFTLKAVGGAASNVRLSASDLMETTTDRAMLSTLVTINPAQVPTIGVNDIQRVDVTLAPGTTRAGTYKGVLSIWYTELTSATPLTLTLQVVLLSKPTLAADVNSVNQTLFAQTRSFPYVGTATVPTRTINGEPPPVLGQLPIALIESSGEDASIRGTEVLAVRSSTGLILPAGAVTVNATLPITVPGAGATTLPLVLQGRNLPAGSYTGTLRVHVANQPAGVQVQFNLKLKDNWLWAFLVLAASLVVGALVTWYNGRGLAALKTLRDINRRATKIEQNPGRLQVAEREVASQLLAAVKVSAQNEESQATIDAQIVKLDEYMQQQAEAVAALLAESNAMTGEIDKLDGAPVIRQDLRKRREALGGTIEQGLLVSLEEGKRVLGELKAETALVPKLQEAIIAAGFDDTQVAAIGLQTAGSVQEVGENMRALLVKQVDTLIAAAGRVEIGALVRNALVVQARDARERLKVADLAGLSPLIPGLKQIKADVDTLQSYQQTWIDKGRPDDGVVASLDATPTLAELGQAIEALPPAPPPAGGVVDAGEVLPPASGAGLAADPLDGFFSVLARFTLGERASAEERAWTAYEFKVQTGGLVVKGLLYLFAMLVGWAALYVSNQTFGARPEDYIALFLWGATVNVIGGQQLGLDAIYQHKTPDLAAAPPANQTKTQNAADNQAGGG